MTEDLQHWRRKGQSPLIPDPERKEPERPAVQNVVAWVDTGGGAPTIDAVSMSKGATCVKGHTLGDVEFCYLCYVWDEMLMGRYPKGGYNPKGFDDIEHSTMIQRGRRKYEPTG